MTKFVYFSTAGFEDPTRATLPFLLAQGALDAGYEVEIILANDATLMMQDRFVWQVHGFGMPPLKDLFETLIDRNISISVCASCAKARGVTDDDLRHKNSKFVNPKEIAEAMAAADKLISI